MAVGLMLQLSAKNSWFFRFMKTSIGLGISRLLLQERYEIPKPNGDYIGLVKLKEYILFEFDNYTPIAVWRLDKGVWSSEPFIGYQLIVEYTIQEFKKKKDALKNALALHWTKVCNSLDAIHGDLTHFNILVDSNNEFHYIDRKSGNHSKLYDIYYFYAYLNQCLHRCTSIGHNERNEIVQLLNELLESLNLYNSSTEYLTDVSTMNIPASSGLINQEAYLTEFTKVIEKSIL